MKALRNKEQVYEELRKTAADLNRLPDEPIKPVPMARVIGRGYLAEIGQKEGFVFYHLMPNTLDDTFTALLEKCLIAVYKFEDRVELTREPDLASYSFRILDGSNNPNANILASRFFDMLDAELTAIDYPTELSEFAKAYLAS